jgi:hypothetical protein
MIDKVVWGCLDKDNNLILDSLTKQKGNDPDKKLFVIVSYEDYSNFNSDCILGVAIKLYDKKLSKSTIYKLNAPNRHDDLLVKLKKQNVKIIADDVEKGFYSVQHEFLSRKDAQVIAIRSGQVSSHEREKIIKSGQTELQSPNVW